MSNKIWQVMPKIDEKLAKKNSEYSSVILQLLYNRGLKEKNEIDIFLKAEYNEQDYDPFLFEDMEKAAELVIKHIKEKNKIVVYGDYDADGVTSSALLVETLGVLKADVSVYIPDRVSEGYGLNKKAIDDISQMNTKLIVTVDGGIRNKEEVEYAKSKNMEVIITDHHMPPESEENLPQCLIINPLLKREKYPFKLLAGVGVAFKLAKALISKTKLEPDLKARLEERVTDLVAIGTVADCVSLTGENRYLVKKGLAVLNAKKRPGLGELIKVAQLNPSRAIDTWNIGFQIAPRLNAAGRMDHANTAFELLITKDVQEGRDIAVKLNERNIERQSVTEEIVNAVESQINKDSKILIGVCPESVENESWKEGVVGLVAGRICERYYRPALVITRSEDGLKGSGRSIEEFNIIKALEECGSYLNKFGGHPAACGFSLSDENLEKFKIEIAKIAEKKLSGVDLRPKLKIEAEISLGDIGEDLIAGIEQFAPFGQNNDKPKFVSYECLIVDIMNMGQDGQHIKLKLKEGNSGIISAIGFGQSEQLSHLQVGGRIDIVYYVEINEFNGRREAQIKIVDIKSE